MNEIPIQPAKRLEWKQTWFLGVAALFVILMFAFVILPYVDPRRPGAVSGELAPDFDLSLLSGGASGDRVRLSDLRGKIVILDFWASWCKPCDEQTRSLATASRELGERARILGVATSDERGAALIHAERTGAPYSNGYDEGGLVGRAYRVDQLPTLVLVDQKGHMRGRFGEVLSAARVVELVAQLEEK